MLLRAQLKIEEEEQSTSRKSTTTSFFSDYERQWSIHRFLDPEVKHIRSRRSYMRNLKTRAINKFNATPKELKTCIESKFIARFMSRKMAIYDARNEQVMEKLK